MPAPHSALEDWGTLTSEETLILSSGCALPSGPLPAVPILSVMDQPLQPSLRLCPPHPELALIMPLLGSCHLPNPLPVAPQGTLDPSSPLSSGDSHLRLIFGLFQVNNCLLSARGCAGNATVRRKQVAPGQTGLQSSKEEH